MNISGISAGLALSDRKTGQKAQSKNNTVNFEGTQKAAQTAGHIIGEAVAGAAGKEGSGFAGAAKFLHAAFDVAKYIGTKVFKGISKIAHKIFSGISGFITPSKDAAQRAEGAFSGKNAAARGTKAETAAAEGIGAKIIPFEQKAEEGIEVIVAGRKFTYRPGKDKLPEGATIQNGTLMLDKDMKNKDPRVAIQKMREAIEMAEQWGKEQ